MEFDRSVHVDAPPEDVLALLLDVQDHVEPPVLSMVKSPPGETRVGTRWREVIRLAPLLRIVVRSEVTELVPGRRLGMVFQQRGFRGVLTYTVEPEDGGTRLRQQEWLDQRAWLRPLAGVMDRSLRPRLEARLDEIRDLLESGER